MVKLHMSYTTDRNRSGASGSCDCLYMYTNAWIDGWIDECIDGWMDEWMEA